MLKRAMTRRRLAVLAGVGVLSACVPGAGTSGGGGETLTLPKAPVTVRALVRPGTEGHVRWFAQQTPKIFEPEHPTIKVVAESWEWIKWITNQENGVAQVAGGAGSPGARDDVWTDLTPAWPRSILSMGSFSAPTRPPGPPTSRGTRPTLSWSIW